MKEEKSGKWGGMYWIHPMTTGPAHHTPLVCHDCGISTTTLITPAKLGGSVFFCLNWSSAGDWTDAISTNDVREFQLIIQQNTLQLPVYANTITMATQYNIENITDQSKSFNIE